MGSHATYLAIQNSTPLDASVKISQIEENDWDGVSHPDSNFDNTVIKSQTLQQQREELNSASQSAWYCMTLGFSNTDQVSFRNDQYDAYSGISPNPRLCALEGPSADKYTLVQSVDLGTNTSTFTITNKRSDPQDWMSRVADSKLLSQLTIPGTHDSTASWSLILSACCQSLSTTDQLNLGIRFLDIRCKQELNALFLMHGPIPEGGPVNGVFNECANFLQAHPKETILMSIRNEGSDDEAFGAALRTAMSAFPSLFYVSDELPTLGAARGKVVFLRRVNVSAAAPWGLALATGWQDNTTFDIQYKSSNGQLQSFHVQDAYGTADVNFKWTQIKACLDMAAGTTDGRMFLNFCSATGSALQLTDPKTMANGITPLLQGYFATARPLTRYGVVVMDFPNEAIVSAMINTNI